MHNLKGEISEFEKPESFASIVKRLGNPESATLLHSKCNVFQISQVDGAIGYYQIGDSAVAIGDPICLPEDIAELTKAFHLYCEECNLKIVYLQVYQDFAHWAINNCCRTLIQVGSELSVNPTTFKQKHSVRWHVKQAIQQGVHVKEYTNFDPTLENQIKKTILTWLKQRKGPQIHLGKINFFNSDAEKRIFYAEQNDEIVGVLMLTPVDRCQGWAICSYLALLDAPVGTTEHLICSTFESLAHENCHYLCLGAVSGTKLDEIIGLSSFGKTLADLIYKSARWFFKLERKANYLKKYRPNSRSTFLLCQDKLTISNLLAIKHALNVKL